MGGAAGIMSLRRLRLLWLALCEALAFPMLYTYHCRAPGAKLRGFIIAAGCQGADVTVYREGQPVVTASGGRAYPSEHPAVIEYVTFQGANRSSVAVKLELGTAAKLHGCLLLGRARARPGHEGEGDADAPNLPLIVAYADSSLEVSYSTLTGGTDGGITFAGVRLVLHSSVIDGNKGSGAVVAPQALPEGMARPALTTVHISSCRFENNVIEGGSGGALHIGPGAVVYINNTVFKSNTADAGEGVACQRAEATLVSHDAMPMGVLPVRLAPSQRGSISSLL